MHSHPISKENTSAAPLGRGARTPAEMPARGWREIAIRTWRESSKDNVGLVAAGVAFYAFLALVPLLGAIVISYGLVATPATVLRNVQSLTSVMPADAARLIGEQLLNVVEASSGKKGVGLLIALGIALFGARNAAGAVITALNIAYEEEEKRGFIKVNLIALAMTAATVILAVFAGIAVSLVGAFETLVGELPGFVMILAQLVSYVVLGLVAAAAAATLYRYAPSRDKPRWVWITPGSLLAAAGWVVATLAFGFYVRSFAGYNQTYGSLGGVIVLLTWIYLSAYVLLFGAELNSETEHQTARDTTAGPEQPLGARGAWAADHVASGGNDDDGDDRSGSLIAQNSPLETASKVNNTAPTPSLDPKDRLSGHPILTSRVAALATPALGGRRIGMLSTILATTGLGLIGRRGRAGFGTALLMTAAALAYSVRED